MVILFVLLEKLIQIPLNNIFLHKVRIFKFKFITEAKDFCVFFDGQYIINNNKKNLIFR